MADCFSIYVISVPLCLWGNYLVIITRTGAARNITTPRRLLEMSREHRADASLWADEDAGQVGQRQGCPRADVHGLSWRKSGGDGEGRGTRATASPARVDAQWKVSRAGTIRTTTCAREPGVCAVFESG